MADGPIEAGLIARSGAESATSRAKDLAHPPHESASGAKGAVAMPVARISLHRLEAFSDAVFAFAITLLVVSLSVPATAQDLFAAMQGFLAFGVCFAILVVIWIDHNRFFKAYPLADGITVSLNMALLFVVLLYVYPMKFLFSLLVGGLMGTASPSAIGNYSEVRTLMLIYGAGFLGIHATLALMRLNARRYHDALHLSARDVISLEGGLTRNVLSAAVALVSMLIAATTFDQGLLSGCAYFLLFPAHMFASWRLRRKLQQASTPRRDPNHPG